MDVPVEFVLLWFSYVNVQFESLLPYKHHILHTEVQVKGYCLIIVKAMVSFQRHWLESQVLQYIVTE